MALVFNPTTGQLDIVDKKKAAWGEVSGTLSDQTDLQAALDANKAQAVMYALML